MSSTTTMTYDKIEKGRKALFHIIALLEKRLMK